MKEIKILFDPDIKQSFGAIENKSLSTKKNYLASVLVFLNPEGYNTYSESLEPTIKEYNKLLEEYSHSLFGKIEEQHKTAKESKNWVTIEDLMKINKKHKNDVRRMEITLKS